MRRLKIEGFFLPDFLDEASQFLPLLRRWHAAGQLDMRFDESQSLENVLKAYERMMTGGNIGKVIVKL